jgi:hypothetical protein
MEERWTAIDAQYQEADTLRFEAETEGDEQKSAAKWAKFESATAAIAVLEQDNADDERLVSEYDVNIRAVNNSLRVTKAKLVAERSNAELMVAIKGNMNLTVDLSDTEAKLEKLQADKAAESDNSKKLLFTKDIDAAMILIANMKKEQTRLGEETTRITLLVTTTGADALTIEARIADEEAQIALDAANYILE